MEYYGGNLYWIGSHSNIIVFDIMTKSIATFARRVNTFSLSKPQDRNGNYSLIIMSVIIDILQSIYCYDINGK